MLLKISYISFNPHGIVVIEETYTAEESGAVQCVQLWLILLTLQLLVYGSLTVPSIPALTFWINSSLRPAGKICLNRLELQV